MQGFDVSGGGYEEFPQSAPAARGGFVFLEQFRLPRRQEDAWGAVSNLDLFFSVRTMLDFDVAARPSMNPMPSQYASSTSRFTTITTTEA